MMTIWREINRLVFENLRLTLVRLQFLPPLLGGILSLGQCNPKIRRISDSDNVLSLPQSHSSFGMARARTLSSNL
jgi:hypothetical protein